MVFVAILSVYVYTYIYFLVFRFINNYGSSRLLKIKTNPLPFLPRTARAPAAEAEGLAADGFLPLQRRADRIRARGIVSIGDCALGRVVHGDGM